MSKKKAGKKYDYTVSIDGVDRNMQFTDSSDIDWDILTGGTGGSLVDTMHNGNIVFTPGTGGNVTISTGDSTPPLPFVATELLRMLDRLPEGATLDDLRQLLTTDMAEYALKNGKGPDFG